MSPERRRRASRPAPGGPDLSPRLQRHRRGRSRPVPHQRSPRARRSPLRALGLNLAATLRVLVLAVEVAGLVALLVSPAFAASEIEVTGNHRITRDEVLRQAGLAGGRSIFLLDPEAAQLRLVEEPWVSTASVRTILPRQVTVDVTERQPYAVYRLAGPGSGWLLDGLGYVLGPAGSDSPAVVVIAAGSTSPSPGTRMMSGRLLQNLARIQQAAPTTFRLHITAWELGTDAQLTGDTSEGIHILFGQMATSEQLDTLDAKLAALTSRVNLATDCYGYVNVENPRVVACGVKPSPSPSPSPSPHH